MSHTKAHYYLKKIMATVEEGWELFELTLQQRSLEEIFVHLTCGDEMDSPRNDKDSKAEITS